MHHAADTLKEIGIPHEVAVHSAHRTPDRLVDWIKDVEGHGAKVFIAGAGMAAARLCRRDDYETGLWLPDKNPCHRRNR